MLKNGIIKDTSAGISTYSVKIIWLLGIEGSVKNGRNNFIFSIACLMELV